MTAFTNHREAARELLMTAPLRPREGQFCGGICFSDDPLTEKQRHWLEVLLKRHSLPPLLGRSPVSAAAFINAPVVERYAPALEALRPGCSDVERRRRCGIMYMRDRASAGLRVAGWEAGLVLQTIEALASVHAFATMHPDELETLHGSLVRLLSVAQSLDMRGPRGDVQ